MVLNQTKINKVCHKKLTNNNLIINLLLLNYYFHHEFSRYL
ncbi:hypothetical protein c7_R1236 [Megavirus courdo7]|uniref:Uncharacterized protein n=1 Tax=Megavirus courdo7 TaxID=1128135 RepID=H2ECG0_9VIRU|nr:hypothetical protein c7_R1236 [Megavirus courdo7]